MPRPLYVDDEFERVNKKVFKRERKNVKGTRFYGSTATSAVDSEKLLELLETLETDCEFLLNEIDTGIPRISRHDKTVITISKKIVNMVKQSSFAGFPITTIEKLNEYVVSLTNYYERFAVERDQIEKELPEEPERFRPRIITREEQQLRNQYDYLNFFADSLAELIKQLEDKIMIYNSGAVSRGIQAPIESSVKIEGGSLHNHPMFQNREYVIPYNHKHFYPANYPFPRYMA